MPTFDTVIFRYARTAWTIKNNFNSEKSSSCKVYIERETPDSALGVQFAKDTAGTNDMIDDERLNGQLV